MEDLEVGDRVEIVNDGKVYIHLPNWAEHNNVGNLYKDAGNVDSTGCVGFITVIKPRDDTSTVMVAAVDTDKGTILINLKGLRLAKATFPLGSLLKVKNLDHKFMKKGMADRLPKNLVVYKQEGTRSCEGETFEVVGFKGIPYVYPVEYFELKTELDEGDDLIGKTFTRGGTSVYTFNRFNKETGRMEISWKGNKKVSCEMSVCRKYLKIGWKLVDTDANDPANLIGRSFQSSVTGVVRKVVSYRASGKSYMMEEGDGADRIHRSSDRILSREFTEVVKKEGRQEKGKKPTASEVAIPVYEALRAAGWSDSKMLQNIKGSEIKEYLFKLGFEDYKIHQIRQLVQSIAEKKNNMETKDFVKEVWFNSNEVREYVKSQGYVNKFLSNSQNYLWTLEDGGFITTNVIPGKEFTVRVTPTYFNGTAEGIEDTTTLKKPGNFRHHAKPLIADIAAARQWQSYSTQFEDYSTQPEEENNMQHYGKSDRNNTNLTVTVDSSKAFQTVPAMDIIYGQKVSDMSEYDLFNALRRIESESKTLTDLGTGKTSKRITKQIAALKDAAVQVTLAIDALPEDVDV